MMCVRAVPPRGTRSAVPAAARGATLVDLLIGLAIGLFIVSQGLVLLAAHLHEHKGLVLEARLMQDLRGAAAAVSRDLQRAGHWGDATAALWQHDTGPRSNPYQLLTPTTGPTDTLRIRYSRDENENHVVDGNEEFGFRLRNQAIEAMLGGSWQTLTDTATVRVSSFRLTPISVAADQPMLCDKPCPAAAPGLPTCPPQVVVRHVHIDIAAQSPLDPAIRRTLQTSSRLRNDALLGECPP